MFGLGGLPAASSSPRCSSAKAALAHRMPSKEEVPMSERDHENDDRADVGARRPRLLTVKEYADVARQHPQSVYRRIRTGRQVGVHRVGGSLRLEPPDDADADD